MSNVPDHPLTVSWVLFSFRGRIGRKSFALAALGMILVQAAIVAQIIGTPEDSPQMALWGLALLAAWVATAWAALALAVKRLHDIGLPGVLALLLLIPAVSFLTFVVLAVWPPTQETNAHGPPPFPRERR
ncbi:MULTISPECIES: DUF805 domain-containing protein [unclassified Roseitalea]|uniref:DUF805 domain-containing protein n=1 Tax=unclassified Roseitalea TaxID=2639107 RepID=UPI00273EE287|nr:MULTISPECIES: DUF805 domain-containing protein [unclassified Roseitalea]